MKRNTSEMESKWQRMININGSKTKAKLVYCVILFFLFALPLNVMAAKDRFVLNFEDCYMNGTKGEPATLYLKKALRQQYPGIDVTDFRLLKVVLLAKTKKGKGVVQLRVGPEVSDSYRVGGHPRGFRHNKRDSFDRVSIENPYNNSRGPWQLNLQGKFKVRKVVLVVKERKRHHYGWWSPGKRDRYFRVW